MTTAAEVVRVLNDHPDLGIFGFGKGATDPDGADFLEQVQTARVWIKDAAPGLIERRGSYPLKHMIQAHTGRYISNGATILACILSGFAPVQRLPGPNCRFKQI